MAAASLAGFAILAACGSTETAVDPPAESAELPTVSQNQTSTPVLSPSPAPAEGRVEATGDGGFSPYLLLNQRWVEALSSDQVDVEDVDEMFWYIFSRLPGTVMVYPSENYYYWILYVDRRQIWGNIRLPAGRRDNGVLTFAYFEFKESLFGPSGVPTRSKFFTVADGLRIEKNHDFSYVVHYRDKSVTFDLHRLSQDPPKLFPIAEDEVFVERTFDESGYQFFLLFNEKKDYFFWVLNEEEIVPDDLEPYEEPLHESLVVGRRSGFAFWVDAAHGNRKVLAAIYGQHATRNNYYDGPFDQLADNYADEIDIKGYMERAFPNMKGRIDKYGYITDKKTQ